MTKSAGWKALAIALTVACPLPAMAIGAIVDNDVRFEYTTDFLTSSRDTVNVDFTGAGTGDMAFESWWFYRVQGDSRENAFGNPDGESYSGAFGRLDWSDPGGSGLFNAALALEVIDSGVDIGNVFQKLTIVNAGLTDLTIDIFHYSDFDLGGTANDDSAVLVANPDGIQIDVSDGTETAPMIGYGAAAYEVNRYSRLLRDLTDGNVDDMDNSGLPFSNRDFTGGFQWSVTIGVGQQQEFMTQFASNGPLLDQTATAIPEPGAAWLTGLGLIWLARRPRGA